MTKEITETSVKSLPSNAFDIAPEIVQDPNIEITEVDLSAKDNIKLVKIYEVDVDVRKRYIRSL